MLVALHSHAMSNYQEIAQTVCVAPSLTSGVAFYLSQKVGSFVASHYRIRSLLFFPSRVIDQVSGYSRTLNKMSLLAPIAGIAIVSFTAYKWYAISSSFLVSGFICGIHCTAMKLFIVISPSAKKFGFIPLQQSLKAFFFRNVKIDSLARSVVHLTNEKSHNVASLVFFVSSISLTLIFQNPVLANTIACPLASFANIAVTSFELNRIMKNKAAVL